MRRINSIGRIVGFVALGSLAIQLPALAQKPEHDLTQLSLEELMNIEISSASRKFQRAADAPAATFVITRDDIRRSGMTTIPDLLRLAPGVDVAQINGNKWAVSVRGFNGLRANKLLVLVDGRSVYNRLYSGVVWDEQDLMLDDIDRIEVIRGPAAALWGANAVNGVINIVTKSSADTQGGLVRVDAGRFGEQGAVRYGGKVGSGSYRVFTQWTGRDESLTVPGVRAGDGSRSSATGFKADWGTAHDVFMMEGGLTTAQARPLWPNLDPLTAAAAPIATDPSDAFGVHLVGRWTRTLVSGASLQVQSYVDIASRQEPIADYNRHNFAVDTQYHTAFSGRHDVVAGGGYRVTDELFRGATGISLTPARSKQSLLTAFVQDEIAMLGNRLAVTVGSEGQYDSDAGAALQPTVRALWNALPRQRVWAAASRALRTPSLQDRGIHVTFPPVPTDSGLPLVVMVAGDPGAQNESLGDFEAGYRLDIQRSAWISATGFVGRYHQLQTVEPGAPVVKFVPAPQITVTSQFGNLLTATTRGLEVEGHWSPSPIWHLDGSYTAFHLSPDPNAASLDLNAAREDGSAPRTQWQLRSVYVPVARATLGFAIFHVGPLERLQVSAYTRADISAEWRFNTRLSAMVTGQNLLDAAHAEFGGSDLLLLATQVPRALGVRLRWEFK